MPKNENYYELFNREFYWLNKKTYKNIKWENINNHRSYNKYPHKIGLLSTRYYWESEFDYSKEDSLSLIKPSKILFEGMKMRYAEKEGYFIDRNGETICFDPSVYNESNPYLMVRKDKLLEFLAEKNLTICWTMIGEKQIFTPLHIKNERVGIMQMSGYISLDGDGIIKIKDINHRHGQYNIQLSIKEID